MNDAKEGFTFHHVKNKVHFFMNEPQPKVRSINAICLSSKYTGATYTHIDSASLQTSDKYSFSPHPSRY